LPSALVLVLFAYGAAVMEGPIGRGIIHGLKIVAVAIVASAILGPYDFALALTGFVLLTVWKLPAWAVVLVVGVGGLAVSLLTMTGAA
jgi:chromate transport protein ChrA